MPSSDAIFEWIEIDVPQCVNTFGVYSVIPGSAPSFTKADGDTVLATEVVESDDVTAVFDITVPSSPAGVIWEQGGIAGGLYLGFTGANLVFRAGSAAELIDNRRAYWKTLASKFVGKTLTIVVRVDVSASTIYITVIEAGLVLVNSRAVATGGFPSGLWASTENGAVGVGSGTVPFGESAANYNGTITNARFWNSFFSVQTGCTARLFNRQLNKCWQLRGDCGDLNSFNLGTPLTLRFCKEDAKPPKDGNIYFPVLNGRITTSSGTVNIAGSDPKMSGLGRQSVLDFSLEDFRYHERGIDKYYAERLSGVAQFSGIGYDPEDFFFLTKLKIRWPNYPDAVVRHCVAYLRNGVLEEQQTRHFYLKEWSGPNGQTHSMKCKGVLDFANKVTALAPKPSSGRLISAATNVQTTLTLTPAGVGDLEYPSSGEVCLSSEVMSFTRVGDVLTVVRGIAGTQPRSHSIGAAVQLVLKYDAARVDTVLNDLVDNYTDTPATYLRTAVRDANADEIDRWASSIRLTTRVCAPTAVSTLLGELADLGFILWENDRDRSLNLRANRPFDDPPRIVSDRKIKSIRTRENEDQRLTQVRFLSKRTDPTKQLSDDNNYEIRALRIDGRATQLFEGVRTKTVYCRWFDQGDLNAVNLITLRFLNRFSRAPRTWEIVLDAEERDIDLADVIQLETDQSPTSWGETGPIFVQVYEREEPQPFHDIKISCQSYQYSSRYSVIAPNTVPVYSSATDEQKARYGFASPDEEGFDDGAQPYRIV